MLYHYFDTLILKGGAGALVGYQVVLRNPADGTIVPIYADQNGTPIASVSLLTNIALTDSSGNYSLFVAYGTYNIEFRTPDGVLAGTPILQVPMLVGEPGNTGDTGPPGPAQNFRVSLAALKAAAITDRNSTYDRSLWTWETSNAPYVADDINTVKADSTSLSVGAWIRQSATQITFAQPLTGAKTRNVSQKLGEIVSLQDSGAIGDGSDATAGINAAGSSANTAGGRGFTVAAPNGTYTLSSTISGANRVKIAGAGALSTIFNAGFNSTLFKFDSITSAGMAGARLGFGAYSGAIGIALATTTDTLRDCQFSDLEIAGGMIAGQIGFRAQASNSNILTECSTDRMVYRQVDQPMLLLDEEGNWHTRITIDQFAVTAHAAIEARTNVDFFEARIAGAPAAGSVGYRQRGFRNFANLAVDIGAASTAIDIGDDAGDIIILRRPETLTPIGPIGRNNTVIDTECTYVPRLRFTGGMPTSGAFALVGFGTGATITQIGGSDGFHGFKITVGTTPSANPTIKYTYLRSWDSAPMTDATVNGIAGVTISDIAETTTYYQLQLSGALAAGNVLFFRVRAG